MKSRTYKDFLKLLYENLGEEQIVWDWLDQQDLDSREKSILKDYFASSMSLQQIAEKHGVTRERIRQIVMKTIDYLKHPERRHLLSEKINRTEYWGNKISTVLEKLLLKLDKMDFDKDRWVALGELLSRPVSELDLCARIHNVFRGIPSSHNAKFKKIETIRDLVSETEESLLKRKNIGIKSIKEIKAKLVSLDLELGMIKRLLKLKQKFFKW